MSSGATAQDQTWALREQGEEATYIREKEQSQLAALREQQTSHSATKSTDNTPQDAAPSATDRDFEGGFGGQEDLEDRYATTSGEH